MGAPYTFEASYDAELEKLSWESSAREKLSSHGHTAKFAKALVKTSGVYPRADSSTTQERELSDLALQETYHREEQRRLLLDGVQNCAIERRLAERLCIAPLAKDIHGLPPVCVQLTIVGAEGLRQNDVSDSSHIYCSFSMQDQGRADFVTHTVSSMLRPVWNHTHEFEKYVPGKSLEISLWCERSGSDRLMGRSSIEYRRFASQGLQGYLNLEKAGKTLPLKVCLEISVLSDSGMQHDISSSRPNDAQILRCESKPKLSLASDSDLSQRLCLGAADHQLDWRMIPQGCNRTENHIELEEDVILRLDLSNAYDIRERQERSIERELLRRIGIEPEPKELPAMVQYRIDSELDRKLGVGPWAYLSSSMSAEQEIEQRLGLQVPESDLAF